MELDRADASILATVVFIIVFVLSLVVSTFFVVLLAIYLNEFSILGGSSGFSLLDVLFFILILLSGWAACFLSRKTYQAVLLHAKSL